MAQFSEKCYMRKVSISASYDDDQGSSIDFDVSDSLLGTQGPRRVSRKRLRGFISRFTTSALWFFLAVAIAVITLESVYLVHVLRREETRLLGPTGISLERTVSRINYVNSKYMSPNEQVASKAWNEILAGHGVIAVDADFVAEKELPPSIALPDDSGNFMYVIEAYHAMHCLKVLREHYVLMEQNQTWNWSRPHDMHCFDALRRYVMCNVDDTILWTNGNRDVGHGQEKKCNDWDALRDFAESKSARFFDSEPEKGIRHLDNYHEGDGLMW